MIRLGSTPNVNVLAFESRTERLLNMHKRLEVSYDDFDSTYHQTCLLPFPRRHKLLSETQHLIRFAELLSWKLCFLLWRLFEYFKPLQCFH